MAVPAPRTDWENGNDTANVVMAADLNAHWRDVFRWLYGDTSPGFAGYSTTVTAVASASGWVPLPIDVETEKRFVTHTAGSATMTATETGWYQGGGSVSWATSTGTQNARYVGIRIGGSTITAVNNQSSISTNSHVLGPRPVRFWVTAGQTIELVAKQNAQTTLSTQVNTTTNLSLNSHVWFEYVSKGA